jgi:putative pyoverdin transport system ATP-binding/permease protein
MEFLRFLRAQSNRGATGLVVVSVFSGLLSTLLIALIISSAGNISPGRLDLLNLAKFVLCLAAYVLSRRYLQTQSTAQTEEIVVKSRLRVLDKIRRSNLLQYERLGRGQISTVLNESAMTLSASAGFIATGFSSALMLVFATFYVAYLSMRAFGMVSVLVVVAWFMYASVRKKLESQLVSSTAKDAEFFSATNHLLDGFKETKVNRARSDDLRDHISAIAEEGRRLRLATGQLFATLSIVGQNFLYVLLAVLIFVFPAFGDKDVQNVTQVATAIIFIIGPLGEVVAAVPLLMRCNSAVRIIRQLEATLDNAEFDDKDVDLATVARFSAFHQISLSGVSFAYEHRPRNGAFHLGPLDLDLKANELLFVVGGNGTGKSTLLKLITGLYKCQQGSIKIDGQIVGDEELPAYRSLFSIVFTDFHLFDRLYGLADVDRQLVDKLLMEMQLQNVTGFEDGRFKRVNLSTGQRKRLALIVALLEQRPILVFDEVAADQDPTFRRYFYEVLLRNFKAEGKTILAVTHDDHYFWVADRTVKMEDGKFVELTR